MFKPKTGLESLGAQIAFCSKTLLLHNFKWREIVHCKTDRGGGTQDRRTAGSVESHQAAMHGFPYGSRSADGT